jgi:beta-mannosidase
MKKAGTKFYIILLLLASHSFLLAQSVQQALLANWEFTELGKKEWLKANVPGTVHTDLMANGKIPDPFVETNESKVQWVENKTWEYRLIFDCDKTIWKKKEKELQFDGLDTYADVFLNDSLLFTAENMFLSYSHRVTALLKKQGNILRIVFHPASELIAKNKTRSEPQNLPGGDRVFIRKAQYQFGWDFAPHLVSAGIWKAVRLCGYENKDIRSVSLRTDVIQEDTAWIEMSMDFFSKMIPSKKPIYLKITDHTGFVFRDNELLSISKGPYAVLHKTLFAVPHPKLWWCNGMGKPNLYEFILEFTCGKTKTVFRIKHGIRKLELETYPDEKGSKFKLLLNDRPVFVKGSNWIPADHFTPRVSDDKYYHLIKDAQVCNMNMLRVWGGGIYESEAFYANCDSLGIMVWQDFMFACAMYPSNMAFNASVMQEIYIQFKRINQHPSVTIWCGNNENEEGWFNWGWQKEMKMSTADSTAIWKGYLNLFHQSIPTLLNYADRNVIYWPSSPSFGWGRKIAYKEGDVHYWGVWWGMEPFSSYNTHVGRFVTEYGFQSMPDQRSFAEFIRNRSLSLSDSAVKSHQKHPTGYETIEKYRIMQGYRVPSSFAERIYISQIMQRDAMREAIEAHRRNQPYCMGTMFWQFNDCWPVTSWSSTDYYGRPKLLRYAIPELYAPQAISIEKTNDSVFVWLINDDTTDIPVQLVCNWISFDGKVLKTAEVFSDFQPQSAAIVLRFSKTWFTENSTAEKGYIRVDCFREEELIKQSFSFLTSDQFLDLKNPTAFTLLMSTGSSVPNQYYLTISCTTFAKDVYLSAFDPEIRFSENGFHLEANQPKLILVNSKTSITGLGKQYTISCVNNMPVTQ